MTAPGSGPGRGRRPEAFDLGDPDVTETFAAEPRAGGDADDDLLEALETPAVEPEAAAAARKRPAGLRWLSLFATGFAGLMTIALGFAVERMIVDLFATFPLFGWIALAFAVLAAVGLAGLTIREIGGLLRIQKVEALRRRADAALAKDDRKAALAVLTELIPLYAADPATARGRAALEGHLGEIIDGRDLIELAEHELLVALDRRAVAAVVASAKRVAAVTALSPRALVDVAYVAFEALGLVRRLAGIYGGRPGTLGFLRVLRHAIAHLAVTGGMAAGDSLIHEIVGQGLASRLSAKLGEGVVNGLMTARLGLAAIDVIRPLPFSAVRRPRVADVLKAVTRATGTPAGG